MERTDVKALSVSNFQKTYSNGVRAVRGVDFSIEKQQVCALLGPNGAGKTTTIKAILGLFGYQGEIRVFGKEINEVRDRISFVPEEKNLYEYLTPEKLLRICLNITNAFSRERALKLIDHFGLPMDKKISSFSNGMKTALYLSVSLAQDADLYILDEPTWGLDPIKRDDILELIREKVIDGKTVFYTSHIIPEVEKIADRVLIMYEGKMLFSGVLDDIKENFRIFYLPLSAIDKVKGRGYYSVAKELNRISVLSNKHEEWEELIAVEDSETIVPDLNEFFQTLVRGNSNVL